MEGTVDLLQISFGGDLPQPCQDVQTLDRLHQLQPIAATSRGVALSG